MKKMMLTALVGVSAIAFSQALASVAPAPRLFAEDGHKHGKEEIHKLGRKTIAGYVVSVIVVGEAHAGETVKVDIKLIDAKTDPKALRVWIGAEAIEAKDKVELKKGEKTYAGELKVPAGTPDGAKLWVEVETADTTAKASYDTEHKH